MSDRGSAPPGSVVARGKIRVDARKAIRKLRDHLLVDLHLWACEIVRVAVATGATRLDVSWDTDDVVLTFDGRGLPPAEVVRARDHVLAPDATAQDTDALRVLGIGVSAALGLFPRFVDVTTGSHGAFTRVRFDARHLDDEGAAEPATSVVPAPAGLTTSGMRVQVRKKVRLADLGRLVRGEQPPEVPLLVDATAYTPLAFTLQGKAVPGLVRRALLRVELDEPSLTRGFLEILAGPATMPLVEFLDRGVRISSGSALGLREAVASDLPVRVLVDSPRLPTNASRSEVRLDAELVARLARRVPAAFAVGLEALTRRVLQPGADARAGDLAGLGHTVTFLEQDPAALERALGSLAADVAVARRRGIGVSPAEEALLLLPLLRDAVGRPLSLGELRGGSAETPLLVLESPQPVDPALAPWLEGVVWLHGRGAERALASLVCTPAVALVEAARAGLVRRARALAHPPSPPVLAADEGYVLEESFTTTSGPFAGLTGAFGVLGSRAARERLPVARIFVDDRLLESIAVPGMIFRVDLALAWPGTLVPGLAYDGVARTADLTRAMLYAMSLAARAVGERAQPSDPDLVRLATTGVMSASRELGLTADPSALLGALFEARVWPSSSGGHHTLAELDAYARRTKALLVAAPGTPAPRDGRPVLVDRHAREVLALVRAGTSVVDYTPFLAGGEDAVRAALGAMVNETWLHVPLDTGDVVGFVGVGPNRRRVLHGGVPLRESAYGAHGTPVLVVLEDRGAVPAPDHRGLLHASPAAAGHFAEEEQLLELVMTAVEDGAVLPEAYRRYFELSFEDVKSWVERAKRHSPEHTRLVALRERLARLPARLKRAIRHRKLAAIRAQPPHVALAGADARHAALARPAGHVTVTLCATPHPFQPATVLLDGRRASVSKERFAAEVVLDCLDDTLLTDDGELTDAGERFLGTTANDAILALVREAVNDEGFADDETALALCEALIRDDVGRELSITAVLGAVRWPTVQGPARRLGLTARFNTGPVVYPGWLVGNEPSPFDEPALHLPPGRLGALRATLLAACGVELVDAGQALAQLQARRARGVDLPPPQLEGPPRDRRLRAKLTSLGARTVEGELELTDASRPAITQVNDDGSSAPACISLRCPVRVVFRPLPGTTDLTATRDIDGVTSRLLRSLAGSLDDLPPFVRAQLRRVICVGLGDARSPAADASAEVFPDVRGFHWSLARLRHEASMVRHTTEHPSPWPEDLAVGAREAFLAIDHDEARALGRVLAVDDATDLVRRSLRGRARRLAPPVTDLRLGDEVRAQCIYTTTDLGPTLRGEVGVLEAEHAASRGVSVHTTMRPVATIADGAGWPLVGRIDVDGLATNAAFDALVPPSGPARIQAGLRAVVATRADGSLVAPEGALASVVVPPGATVDLGQGVVVPYLAVFWLTSAWPEQPLVELTTREGDIGVVEPSVPAAETHGLLPVGGRIHVLASGREATAATHAVLQRVHDELLPGLFAAARARANGDDDELRAYAWDLRLLGVLDDASAFVELGKDDPDPALVRVVALRAPALLATPEPAPDVPPPDRPESASDFFAGMVKSVTARVRPPAPLEQAASPFARALLARLEALALTGRPVVAVVETRRGRPVRYEPGRRSVIVNTSHDDVARAPLESLVDAALSEINRELEHVTDAEETALLVAALREA